MSKLVFKLRNVPIDEAQDVRELLEKNNIDYFETSAGNWGISLPAIWVHDAENFEFARELIDNYQDKRSAQLRREYQLKKANGEEKTLWQSFKANPFRFIFFSALIIAVLTIYMQVFVFF